MSPYDVTLSQFSQLLLDVSQFRVARRLRVGSTGEVEQNYWSLQRFTGLSSSNYDALYYMRDQLVFRSTDKVPSLYRGSVIQLHTEGLHPGYAVLKMDDQVMTLDDTFLRFVRPKADTNISRQGIHYRDYYSENVRRKYELSKEQANVYANIRDNFYTFHSPYWPNEAREWISRQRSCGSTRQKIRSDVVSYGCDFVCVPYDLSKVSLMDNEWRIEFSVAELMLIKAWSTQQRIVYRTIRVLYKKSLNENFLFSYLCTYYLKTLMLWAVDTRPQNSWFDMIESTRYILHKMIECLKIKHLPHYFIPSNNLLDHLESVNVDDDIEALQEICDNVSFLGEVLEFCSEEEMMTVTQELFIASSPRSIINSMIVKHSIDGNYDNFTSLFSNERRQNGNLTNILQNELSQTHSLTNLCASDVVSNKSSHLNSCDIPTSKVDTFSKTEVFRFGKVYNGNLKVKMFYNLKKKLEHQDWVSQPAVSLLSTNSQPNVPKFQSSSVPNVTANKRKQQLYSRRGKSMSRLVQAEDFPLASPSHSHSDGSSEVSLSNLTFPEALVSPIQSQYFPDSYNLNSHWPGFSPTLPSAWFINKAYTANLLYTLLSDSKTTSDICEQIISAFIESKGKKTMNYTDQCLAFILSTRWIKMYCREIQKLLGLSALCRFVTHESGDRSVHLPVCPVLFAHYLKYLCSSETEKSVENQANRTLNLKDFREHQTNCLDKYYYIYGSALLGAATYIHGSHESEQKTVCAII